MGPELDDVVRVVERIPVPVTWDDVQARVDVGETVVVPLASPVRHRGGARRWTWAAVALAVVGVGAAVLAPGGGDEDVAIQAPPTTAGTGGPTSQPPSATVTTQPATRTWRGGAVAVWTGTALLVWGGEAGDGERSGRADGFVHDPASGATTAIPPAPIPPRTQPAGVWTGEELLVCCGLALTADESYGTANAAAYDPATGEWRRLAPPPAEATRSYGSAVWTGTEMLVLFGQSGSWAEG